MLSNCLLCALQKLELSVAAGRSNSESQYSEELYVGVYLRSDPSRHHVSSISNGPPRSESLSGLSFVTISHVPAEIMV